MPMQPIGRDSPAAVARVVALAMMADASFHPCEVDALERVQAWRDMGLSRPQFLAVASRAFEEQMQSMRRHDRARLLDDAALDQTLDAVTEPALRQLAYRLVVEVLPADGRLGAAEMAVLQRLLDRWQLADAALAHALV